MTKRFSRLLAAWPSSAAGVCRGLRRAEDEGDAAASGGGAKLSLVAYSTPKEAYEELIPAFKKTAEGKGVEFDQSYGASGDQSRAVEPACRPTSSRCSLAPDVDKLVEPGHRRRQLGRQRRRTAS